jgi:hypothetical protein
MAIIYSYPKVTPTLSDAVIGTQFDENGNPTKTFLISDIVNLAVTSLPPGPTGPQGATGPSGPIGPQGPTGSSGSAGPQGQQGVPGPVGPAGLNWQGTWSALNTYSIDDAVGYSGASWFCINPVGPSVTPPNIDPTNWSLLASQGATGPQGPAGATGSAGPTGAQGPAGATGAQGLQGATGLTGSTGAQGPAGATGPIGPQGLQGSAGTAGPQGTPGTPGPIGPAGLNWQGQWTAGTLYLVNDAVGYNGASYFCISPTNGVITPDLDTGYWALLASQGATGPAGPQGPTGLTGVQGPEGSTGPIGLQGPAGPTGATGATGPAGASGGITSLNALTNTAQILAIGVAGNNFAINSVGNVHTFNLPDASAIARGVLNTGIQSINGVKTFLFTPLAPTPSLAANNTQLATTAWVRQLPANITLTTTGTSGAATYNITTGALNIPQYGGGTGIAWLESNATDLTVWNNGKGNVLTNTSFGDFALKSYTSLNGGSTAIGFSALQSNTSGYGNTAVGAAALSSNTSAINNVAIGNISMQNNTTGGSNTAVGHQSMQTNTAGGSNTALGCQAMGTAASGNNNTATGAFSLMNTSGSGNTANGSYSLNQAVGANNNTVVGSFSGYGITTGNGNVCVGALSGAGQMTGLNSIYIGYNTGALINAASNEIVIGNNMTGLGTNTTLIGTNSTSKTILRGQVGIGTTSPSNSTALQVDSTIQGFLPPRMTTTQKNAIVSPAIGLIVFDTTLNKLCVRGLTNWETITSI